METTEKREKTLKVALFDAKPYDRKFFEQANQDYGYQLKFFEYKLNEETATIARGFDVVCAFVNDDLSQATIEVLANQGITLIAMRCAGYNNVDFKAAYQRIHVVRVPAYSPYAVAEHTAALMLTLNRKTHRAYQRTRESNFNINGLIGFDLHGKKLGIIGTGKIGQAFASIGRGFGMKLLAYDKYPNEQLGLDYMGLEQLFAEADVISLHCPLTKETHHIINQQTIKQMKTGVMLLNTSRGGLIDSEALIEGLKSRKIGSAGLDVYEEESEYFFEDFSDEIIKDDTLARLLSFNNVLITSHQGFLTDEAIANIASQTLENIRQFFTVGVPIINEVRYFCDEESGNCRIEVK